MNEDSRPWKLPWKLLDRSHSHPQQGASGKATIATRPSSLMHSRDGSRGGPPKLFRELWSKVSTTNSNLSVHKSQDPSLHTPLVPNPKLITSGTAGADLLEPNGTLADARGAPITDMSHNPRPVQSSSSASDNIKTHLDTVDAFAALMGPLKVFNSVVDEIADLHPYAKAALSTLTSASKIILSQAILDGAISHLLFNVSTIYIFVAQRDSLAKMSSMLETYSTIAQHTLKCAEFIAHYSKKKGFWKRLSKHARKSVDNDIASYSDTLEGLIQQFQHQSRSQAAESLDLCDIEYAAGAGLDTSRCCLSDTRNDLLAEIKSWIRSTGEDVPRVLWLSGTAGKGKSAIACTIASWFNELGGLGACFCFDRTWGADHEKIFTTITRDLANSSPAIQQALASIFHEDEELWKNAGLIDQWRKFVVQSTSMAAITAPILIVIDALDESREGPFRELVLRVLSGELKTFASRETALPANFRILVTSRPLEDVCNSLCSASYVRHLSLDDSPAVSTERDIRLYISTRLADLHSTFDDAHFKTLAQKSDGLFEWARLACEYIMSDVGVDPMDRFKAVVSGTPGSCSGEHLLDDMYGRFLKEIITEDAEIAIFRSVMGQVLGSLEPLSMTALAVMRQHFPGEESRYEVEHVMKSMGVLLSGTLDPHTPIRPLHISFYDFLADESRSDKFFVDVSSVKRNVAFASLRVMKDALRFNICSLEDSYLPNSAVLNLTSRVKECIPTELSYSCRFWCAHVQATPFEPLLAEEIEAFFNGERLLFWLEALALTKQLDGSIESLSSIADWSTGHAGYMNIGDAARDARQFVRVFGTAILHSTPHLYLSALPLSPTQSRIFMKFAAKFPSTPQVVAGHVTRWPLVDKALNTRAEVQSVAFSPDGKTIAYGTDDGMIRLWDMESSGALGTPFQGHTASVRSVEFSPDGRRIVSGSWDKTVRVWDTETHEAIGFPIQGHTDYVECVAISPDGRRIVSCSWDKTIRVWDMKTGNALGDPLKGHTGYVWSVVVSPDGKCIVSGSEDKTVRVWDVETGKLLCPPLQGHLTGIRSVAISPDGKRIVSGGSGPDDTTLQTWDVETGRALGNPFHGHFGDIWAVKISPDGKRIVSSSIDRTVRVWDIETGETLGDPLRGHLGRIRSVAISPDGHLIASGSDDKMIRVWDANTGKAHMGRIWSVAISSDGKRIVSGSDDTMVRVWDAETGNALGAPLRGHSKQIWSVALSSDGRRIVSGSDDETIRIWDACTGEALGQPLRGHFGPITSVAIFPDGKRIVSGSDDQTIRVWDIETGEIVGPPFRGHTQSVQSVAISPDGKHIVSSSGQTTFGSCDGMIQLRNAENGEVLGTLLQGHAACVRCVAISLDGKTIVSGSGDTIHRWDAETRRVLGTPLQGHADYVHSVAISPDGKCIISGDHTFRLWNTETGEALNVPLICNSDDLLSVAISANGQHIVSGSSDMTIRVWDPELLTSHQPAKPPIINFSSNRTHALCHVSSLLQGFSTPASLVRNEKGWIVGPGGRLLFWIPTDFYRVIYAPGNTLVIPNNALQLDLSRFAHGALWYRCREQATGASH